MTWTKAYQKRHAKARRRRYLQAQERLERDRRQAQQAATILEQALHELGLPENLVRMLHMCWAPSDGSSKFMPIDEEPNHQIVHAFRLGKA